MSDEKYTVTWNDTEIEIGRCPECNSRPHSQNLCVEIITGQMTISHACPCGHKEVLELDTNEL